MAAISEWELFELEQFNFSPTSLELIGHYLKKKLKGELGPKSAPILEVEMYGKGEQKNPWNLFGGDDLPWQSFGKNSTVLYVFTHLSNVGKTEKSSNKQKSRVAGDGSWRNNKEVPVVDANKIQIGYHRTLTFRSNRQTQGHWNMDEFAIDPAAFPGELEDHCQNLVLCRISSKSSDNVVPSSKKRKSALMLDDDDSCIKRQKLAVPQEQTAYVQEKEVDAAPEVIDLQYDYPPPAGQIEEQEGDSSIFEFVDERSVEDWISLAEQLMDGSVCVAQGKEDDVVQEVIDLDDDHPAAERIEEQEDGSNILELLNNHTVDNWKYWAHQMMDSDDEADLASISPDSALIWEPTF